MNILKYQEFSSARRLALFVNNNNIQRENILIITNTQTGTTSNNYTVFYYGDSEVKEETPGFFD
jgi:hypothetical protein